MRDDAMGEPRADSAAGVDPSRALRRYRAWYRLVRAWSLLQIGIFLWVSALFLLVVWDRLFFLEPDMRVAVSGGAALLLSGLVVSLALPRRAHTTAYLVDRAAGLKNLVCSALSVSGDDGEAEAVVCRRAAAALRARSPAQLIRPRFNRWGKLVPAPLLMLGAALMLPPMDLLGREETLALRTHERDQVLLGARALQTRLELSGEKRTSEPDASLARLTDEYRRLASDLEAQGRRDALLRLGEFETTYREQFSEQRDFEAATRGLDYQPATSGLDARSRERLRSLGRRLERGEMAEAAGDLRELGRQFRGHALTDAQKAALGKELARLSEQLRQGRLSPELARLLSRMDAAAVDPQQLRDAFRVAADELEELARLCEDCRALKEMRDGLKDAKRELLGEAFCDFDAADVEGYLAAQAALGCKSGQGETGGEGKGKGGEPPESATPTGFKSELSPGKLERGRILQQLLVPGVPDRGESRDEYSEVVRAARQHAAGALAGDDVPREYQDVVKGYFDALEQDDE